MRLRVLVMLAMLSSTLFLMGQAGETNPDGCTLQIKVVYQNERAVNDVVHLQLLNHQGIPVQEVMTNKQGLGVFYGLRPGEYRVKADSLSITESATGNIEIMDNESHHDEWLHVQPRDSAGAGSSGVIDANVPEKARKEWAKGVESFQKNDNAKAAEHLQKAIEIYPQYAQAWNDLGVVKAKSGDLAGAKEAWQKAMAADAKFAGPYVNVARTMIAQKQFAEAEEQLKKALAMNANNAEALYVLVSAEYLHGEFKPALENVAKLHALEHKRFADAHVYAGQMLLNENQDRLAMAEFETYLKEAPDGQRVAAVKKAMAQIQASAK